MRLGYVSLPERGASDRLAAEVARALADRGLRVAGAIQSNRAGRGDGDCDMDLRVLPDGPSFRISLDLGPGSTACRLDADALERAAAAAASHLPGASLVVAKFGKHEAGGRGFRLLMAEALGRGLPVLVSVSPGSLPDFLAFADGAAVPLPAEAGAAAAWLTGTSGRGGT
jgi:Protein of unknown function (DUF2478)